MNITRRLTRLTQLTLVACVLGLGTTSASAAETSKSKYWQSSATTIGSTETCRPNADDTTACTSSYVLLLQMSKDQDDAKACLSVNRWTQNPDGSRTDEEYVFGCSSIDRHHYTIDQHLKQATLEPTTVTLADAYSGATRTVSVAATWLGIGERIDSEYEYHEKTGGCHVNSDYGYVRRAASGRVTIDDAYTAFNSADMLISEGKSHIRCELGA